MTDARTMTESLGGDWFRSYGTAPCPVCQQAGRKEQDRKSTRLNSSHVP